MHSFLLSPIERKILIDSITEKLTTNILNAVKNEQYLTEQQKQLLITKAVDKLSIFLILRLDRKASKKRLTLIKQHNPNNTIIKEIIKTIKDIVVGALSGAIGTLVIPKLQEFIHCIVQIIQ